MFFKSRLTKTEPLFKKQFTQMVSLFALRELFSTTQFSN